MEIPGTTEVVEIILPIVRYRLMGGIDGGRRRGSVVVWTWYALSDFGHGIRLGVRLVITSVRHYNKGLWI